MTSASSTRCATFLQQPVVPDVSNDHSTDYPPSPASEASNGPQHLPCAGRKKRLCSSSTKERRSTISSARAPVVPIPFSFQPTGLISVTENFPLIGRTTPSLPRIRPARSGPITDLLRMRTVIDGLLRSLSATAPDNQQRIFDLEDTGATVPELPDPVSTRNTAQPTRANATRRSCPHPRRDHHQGGQPSRAADRQGDRNDKSNREAQHD